MPVVWFCAAKWVAALPEEAAKCIFPGSWESKMGIPVKSL